MTSAGIQSDEEMTNRSGKGLPGAVVEGAKPYLVAILIVTVLLSVWIGLCTG
jgi:hypothetical protein